MKVLLIIVAIASIALQQQPDTIFQDGFESGDTSAWTYAHNATVVDHLSHSGKFSMAAASDATTATTLFKEIESSPELLLDLYLRPSSMYSPTRIATLSSPRSIPLIFIECDDSHNIRVTIRVGDSEFVYTEWLPVARKEWNHVRVTVAHDAVVLQVERHRSSVKTTTEDTNEFNMLAVGAANSKERSSVHIDDISIGLPETFYTYTHTAYIPLVSQRSNP